MGRRPYCRGGRGTSTGSALEGSLGRLRTTPTATVRAMGNRPNKPSRGQHFIPRLHLRGFAPDGGRGLLCRYDKTTGRMDRLSVARAAVINHYNSLPPETGHPPDALENQFTYLETVVAPWIAQLRAAPRAGRIPIDAGARDGLAGYLAMLHIRSPVFRAASRRLDTFMESIRIDMLLANPEAYAARLRSNGDLRPDAEIEAERVTELERFRSGEVFVESPEIRSLAHLKLAIEQIRPMLIEMHWTIVRRANPPFLVLGDQPVTLLGPNDEVGDLGFGNDGVDVLVPLSSASLLVMTHEAHAGGIDVVDGDDRESVSRPDWLHLANAAAWRTGARFIFARSPDDLVATEQILDPSERRATIPGPSYRGGDPAWAPYAERIGIEILADDDLRELL